jgi:hypothetical protein
LPPGTAARSCTPWLLLRHAPDLLLLLLLWDLHPVLHHDRSLQLFTLPMRLLLAPLWTHAQPCLLLLLLPALAPRVCAHVQFPPEQPVPLLVSITLLGSPALKLCCCCGGQPGEAQQQQYQTLHTKHKLLLLVL